MILGMIDGLYIGKYEGTDIKPFELYTGEESEFDMIDIFRFNEVWLYILANDAPMICESE